MDRNLRDARNLLWLQWILVNNIGWFAGIVIVGIFSSAFTTEFGLDRWWGIGLVAFFVGVAQWRLLRNYLPLKLWPWVGLTTLGFGLGQFLAQTTVILLAGLAQATFNNLFAIILVGLLLGLILGASVGVAGWIVLRDRYWIAVNVVGWSLAILATALFAPPDMGAVARLLFGLVSALISSAVTGLWVRERVT